LGVWGWGGGSCTRSSGESSGAGGFDSSSVICNRPKSNYQNHLEKSPIYVFVVVRVDVVKRPMQES